MAALILDIYRYNLRILIIAKFLEINSKFIIIYKLIIFLLFIKLIMEYQDQSYNKNMLTSFDAYNDTNETY